MSERASQSWNKQLAQGDPLNQVSTNVPRGMGPFSTWEEGAIAALKHDGLTSVSDWCIEKVLHWQEKYNGWGYFFRGIPSPYVWGGNIQSTARQVCVRWSLVVHYNGSSDRLRRHAQRHDGDRS